MDSRQDPAPVSYMQLAALYWLRPPLRDSARMRARLAAFVWARGNGWVDWADAAFGMKSQKPLMSANPILN